MCDNACESIWERFYNDLTMHIGNLLDSIGKRPGAVALIFTIALVCTPNAEAGRLSFIGNSQPAIEVTPDRETGLDKVYVLYGTDGVSAVFETSGMTSKPVWYRYSNLGGGYAEEITGVIYDGTASTLGTLEGDMGYIIEDGDSRSYFWIVDYTKHRFSISSVEPSSEQQCDYSVLDVTGDGGPIYYFTINGRRCTLDREIKVVYDNLDWSEENNNWEQQTIVKTIEYLEPQLLISPPALCRTSFSIQGDRFLEEWNMSEGAESASVEPYAVDCRTEARQTSSGDDDTEAGDGDSPGSNVIKGEENDGLGGSAPADITFYAYATDGVIHNEWQMATDPDFENITYRITEQDFSQTFRDEGIYYIRYIGSNGTGTCETFGETYTVSIGASQLKCPNAFTPGASPGVNDEWKVSYRSLLEFDCTIFDRYGTVMCHFKNPSDGWDGKYRGKLVPPGVYYYVITAKGADGKKYNRSGDINILRYKGSGKSPVTPVE